jgi:hypothetical protein
VTYARTYVPTYLGVVGYVVVGERSMHVACSYSRVSCTPYVRPIAPGLRAKRGARLGWVACGVRHVRCSAGGTP